MGKQVKIEVRLDAFNALNHTQFTGVNTTANFASLTDPTITNLPYDASGNLVSINGFGTVNGVAAPRDAAARDPLDVLGRNLVRKPQKAAARKSGGLSSFVRVN